MKILLLVVGKTENSYLKEGLSVYLKRLKHYISFEMTEIIPPTKTKKLAPNQLKKEEGKLLLNKINSGDVLVLLDEGGKEFTSRKFADFLQKNSNNAVKRLVFVVGGAFGFSEEMQLKANAKLALSQMTFSHQMIRLLFVEQLYRGFTIIKGEQYHND